jgi:integrase
MPRRIPKYSLHKASGQAFVRLNGKCIYLGVHDTPESHAQYERLIANWLAESDSAGKQSVTMARLAILYVEHARQYYRKDGVQTSEVHAIQTALRPLTETAGKLRVSDFGPRKLKSVREQMIRKGMTRTGINAAVGRIKRMLKWGVESELVPSGVWESCRAVGGLRRGRSEAVEPAPISPVPAEDIKAVQPYVSDEIWGMIQLQLLTGMRPGEVCMMRLADIDRSESTWAYVPETHKTAHHGRDRIIFIGGKAQAVLKPFLSIPEAEYLFSPQRAETNRNALRNEKRKSPMTPSQSKRAAASNSAGRAGNRYRRDSYARAISRACKAAGVSDWSPNRLRHNAATELRKKFGLETARTVLGHTDSSTTLHYAEADFASAREAIAAVG